MPQELELEVFRSGDYGAKGRWDEAALDRIASGYDPTLHEAPVTLDHAQNGPALGWVHSVRRVGDRLVARLHRLNERLVSLVREGLYKKRSVELYPSFAAAGEGPYLKAVSFLGAAPPEVKGLADPPPEALATTEVGDEELAAAALFAEPQRESVAVDFEEPTEQEAPETSEAQPNAQDALSFSELRSDLMMQGRWRPGWGEQGLELFYERLRSSGLAIKEQDNAPSLAVWFADFLGTLPAHVELSETAAGSPQALAFNELPRGENVDPASLDWHRRAVAFQASHPGTGYSDALLHCAAR